jgi:hypothetical protein
MKYISHKAVTLFVLMITMSTAYSSDFFSHTVLSLPDDPRIEEPWSKTITTQQDWELYFYSTTAHMTFLQGEAPVAPQLDFENYQILAGGLGMKPSGGNILSVENVQELDDIIDIHVLSITPGASCVSIAMISYPSTTILVKKTDKPFRFTISNAIAECE